jgi:hypothetical protein
MSNASWLLPSVRAQITDAFRAGDTSADTEDYLRPLDLGRDLALELVGELIATAMKSFDEDPVLSDRWLAPRLHASLRLTRAEAAHKGMWSWLAVDLFPEYVRWRWQGRFGSDGIHSGTALKRFVGGDRDNALSRLWWGAELFRDGDDYAPAVQAFVKQDVPNTWLILDAVHHPAAAQAGLRILPTLGSKPINRLSTALDHVLTTIQLDAVAPIAGPDAIAIDEWIEETPDREAVLGDELPSGPLENRVDGELIDRVDNLIREVADWIGLPLSGPDARGDVEVLAP